MEKEMKMKWHKTNSKVECEGQRREKRKRKE